MGWVKNKKSRVKCGCTDRLAFLGANYNTLTPNPGRARRVQIRSDFEAAFGIIPIVKPIRDCLV